MAHTGGCGGAGTDHLFWHIGSSGHGFKATALTGPATALLHSFKINHGQMKCREECETPPHGTQEQKRAAL